MFTNQLEQAPQDAADRAALLPMPANWVVAGDCRRPFSPRLVWCDCQLWFMEFDIHRTAPIHTHTYIYIYIYIYIDVPSQVGWTIPCVGDYSLEKYIWDCLWGQSKEHKGKDLHPCEANEIMKFREKLNPILYLRRKPRWGSNLLR